MSNLLLEETVQIDSGESKQFAHYAEKNEITEAYVFGNSIVALCGKIFVPSRDPEKFPICKKCKEIIDSLFLSGGD